MSSGDRETPAHCSSSSTHCTGFHAGCGLPPGPGGLLGGLEGVSYLAVVGLAGWRLSARLGDNR